MTQEPKDRIVLMTISVEFKMPAHLAIKIGKMIDKGLKDKMITGKGCWSVEG